MSVVIATNIRDSNHNVSSKCIGTISCVYRYQLSVRVMSESHEYFCHARRYSKMDKQLAVGEGNVSLYSLWSTRKKIHFEESASNASSKASSISSFSGLPIDPRTTTNHSTPSPCKTLYRLSVFSAISVRMTVSSAAFSVGLVLVRLFSTTATLTHRENDVTAMNLIPLRLCSILYFFLEIANSV